MTVMKASREPTNFESRIITGFKIPAMYFPALVSGLRRLGRWLVCELFQAVLFVAYALHTLGSLRSAFGGGGALAPDDQRGRAIRPRRSVGPARGGRFTQSAAA